MTKEIEVTEEHRGGERLSSLAEGCNFEPDKKQFGIARNQRKEIFIMYLLITLKKQWTAGQ